MIQQYIHPFILKYRLIITYLLYVLRSILHVSIERPLFIYCMYTCIHTVHTYIRTWNNVCFVTVSFLFLKGDGEKSGATVIRSSTWMACAAGRSAAEKRNDTS